MNKEQFVKTLEIGGDFFTIYDINGLEQKSIARIGKLPFCIKILAENLLRKLDGDIVKEEDLLHVVRWEKRYGKSVGVPFYPARVLLQDYTGIPAIVDLAAMRDAMERMGGDPRKIDPLVPVDLIVDHSVQADFHGTSQSRELNTTREYERNSERYMLLRWAQKNFRNLRIVPPGSGICHQINLEFISRIIVTEETDGSVAAFPDTLVGADSHTTMINGIGVLGWGVGGIEAEAVMLGQPYYMTVPEVIGVRLSGGLKAGVTATDLVLHVTQALRQYGVVEKFVEYFGPGVKQLSVPDRATISNMAPEYGATVGFFPVDEKTVEYLALTNRPALASAVEAYTKSLGLFYSGHSDPEYTDVVEIDLGKVQPGIAGPSKPHDLIALKDLKKSFSSLAPVPMQPLNIDVNGRPEKIGEGSVVMAAITSCTNTSNPHALIGAGLLARNAVKRGVRPPSFVKTVLAPGSKVVIRYLDSAGLTPYLECLGFHTAGFGCMTCIGNSGPIDPNVERAIEENNLNVAAVLSGNRNFEARIHQRIRSNFLCSPMLVVAFALAGRINIDFASEPICIDPNGEAVYLQDIWPKDDEISAYVQQHVKPAFFQLEYETVSDGDARWQELEIAERITFQWDERSSYVKSPPYFEGFRLHPEKGKDIEQARVLLHLGDNVTTDHISPAGAIRESYPAGQYLTGLGVRPPDFNSYGARRGNHEVMVRGAFGNIRIKNKLVEPKEGSYTRKMPENTVTYVYDAAMSYQSQGVPLIVVGGSEYGCGSSRDWAAKGPALLGVKAVIAESFERIHRSNLVGMGILPLVFKEGENCETLGLDGSETYSISGIEGIEPGKVLKVKAIKPDGRQIDFEAAARLDTAVEVAYFENGGILPFMLRKLLMA